MQEPRSRYFLVTLKSGNISTSEHQKTPQHSCLNPERSPLPMPQASQTLPYPQLKCFMATSRTGISFWGAVKRPCLGPQPVNGPQQPLKQSFTFQMLHPLQVIVLYRLQNPSGSLYVKISVLTGFSGSSA